MNNGIIAKYRSNLIINRFVKIFSVDVLVKASGFILLPVYLKLMTQAEYGLFGYLMSIISAFSLFLNFGLYVPQIKLYADYKGKERGSMLFTVNAILLFFMIITVGAIYVLKLDYYLISFAFSNL